MISISLWQRLVLTRRVHQIVTIAPINNNTTTTTTTFININHNTTTTIIITTISITSTNIITINNRNPTIQTPRSRAAAALAEITATNRPFLMNLPICPMAVTTITIRLPLRVLLTSPITTSMWWCSNSSNEAISLHRHRWVDRKAVRIIRLPGR